MNNNIDEMVDKDIVLCSKCGERVEKTTSNKSYCNKCAKDIKREQVAEAVRRYRQKKCNKAD